MIETQINKDEEYTDTQRFRYLIWRNNLKTADTVCYYSLNIKSKDCKENMGNKGIILRVRS